MDYAVIIIGAGPTGLSFARSLAGTGMRVLVVERATPGSLKAPAYDGREIALTHQSVRLLQSLGAWDRIPADEISAIRMAKVLDGNSPYALDFDCRSGSVEALGYIVSNHLIRRALFDQVIGLPDVEIRAEVSVDEVTSDDQRCSVRLSDGKRLDANLVVAADSRFSSSRQAMGIGASMVDFGRMAVVCRMANTRPHRGIAYECFRYGGTLAILPLVGDEVSVVITCASNEANALMKMDAACFNAAVTSRFNGQLGRMELTSGRFAYPLVAVWAERFVARRFALIGDAAVGMHPVTAHGFNLGLGGQDLLAREIRACSSAGVDPGNSRSLSRYQCGHRRVARPIYEGTNAIVRLFTDDRPAARLARKITLRLSNHLPFIKSTIRKRVTRTYPGCPGRRS